MATGRKQQQNITMAIVIVALALLSWGIWLLAQPKADIALGQSLGDGTVDITIVKDKTSSAAPEHSWVNQSRVRIDEMQKMIDSLIESTETIQLEHGRQLSAMEEDYANTVEQMALQIANLQEELASTKSAQPSPILNPDYPYADTGSEFIDQRTGQNSSRVTQLDPYSNKPINGAKGSPNVVTTTEQSGDSFGKTFELASNETAVEDNKTRNKLHDYVPAGSYAQAVVISGADAATNVSDRENPIPVLLRVIGPAVTANKKKISGIKGCIVQGSAVGDLSAERVHVRLISMTCTNNRNEVIEQKVAGHVVGSGKSGVRGHVTSREGGLVNSAAIAGALNGLAGAFSQPDGNAGATDVTTMVTNAATAAGVGGVQEAASTLSEYFIDRAEQYQPIVSLYPDTKVEIVFTNGVSLK
jgi:conjugal transfer pilus assembly protein TraB